MLQVNEEGLMKITQSMEKVRASIIAVEESMGEVESLPSGVKEEIEHQVLLAKNILPRLELMVNHLEKQK